MAETVTMPKLGFDMAEGTLVRWVKLEGDAVAKGEVLAEIETDKATVEVESTYSGVVHKHLVQQGAVVPVGTPIATIAAPDETVDDSQGAVPEAAPTQAPSDETKPQVEPKPEVKEEMQKGGITQVPMDQAAVQVDEEKETQGDHSTGGMHASPLARRLAREQGLDLTNIQGTGPGGRIVRKDVEAAAQAHPAPAPAATQAPAQPAAAQRPQTTPPPAPTWTPGAPSLKEELVPVERLRAAIGRRMGESKQQIPHFYVTHTFNVGALMDLRKQVNAALPEDQKVSVNDFIVKAAALALLQFPNLNASLEGDKLHRHGNVNIGSAVAVPGGLMTVVSRDADQKPLRVIASELREMASRARSGRVKPQDIEGSTFSISNLGMYDVAEFLAIINPPEAAILAIGSAAQVPVVENGELRVGWRMNATISVDHRVSDGAEAAQFMQVMAQIIENPLRLLL